MAQLVARLVRNEKVRGSNPLSSTEGTLILIQSGRPFVCPKSERKARSERICFRLVCWAVPAGRE